VSILTVAGYFQLFAEPYVMTQGGPLQSTVSVLYFMYEEGFKWWNLGSASAVAFLLFLMILASRRCNCASRATWKPDEHDCCPSVAAYAAARRCGDRTVSALVDAIGIVHGGRGSERLSATAAAGHGTLANYRQLFGQQNIGRYLTNSLWLAAMTTLLSLLFIPGGLRVRQAALPRP